ncbi:MAG: hypothetical protein H0V46_09230 [Sphingomonas sp.]|nr:hypothetical protein [Sphingomonas sp.]
MKMIGIAAAVLALGMAAPAAAMPVSTFLAKADGLKKKGPLALFSGDLKLLMNTVKADAAVLRSERLAARAAGRPTAFCPPEAGVKLSDKDILTAMQAVPAGQRAGTDTRAALRTYMARRFPCRA